MSPHKPPVALVILDGLGTATASAANTLYKAHMPTLHGWLTRYPHTNLAASGAAVGLPAGYSGNSQVGHLAIGSGRIIEQDLVRMNKLIAHNGLIQNPLIKKYFSQLATSRKTLHIMGLLSDAGVHSDSNHCFAFIKAAVHYNISSIMIHAFLDGRDVPPKSAATYLAKLDTLTADYRQCLLGSITGRFYAMDRDKNWARTQAVYNLLTMPQDAQFASWRDALAHYYQNGITDEFIPPTPLLNGTYINADDGIALFNFRPDRIRQLAASLTDPHFASFPTQKLPLHCCITPVDYGFGCSTEALLKKIPVNNTLKEVLAQHNKTIFSIAETEKYAHITYFFNGEKEQPVATETRVLIPSKKVDHDYTQQPCMSAPTITQAVIDSLHIKPCDFYLINYANADMVGHSGNMQATIKALECLDTELKKLYAVIVEQMNGALIVTADHGKAETMVDPSTHQPRTAHTANPAPFICIQKNISADYPLPLSQLADIAPFILQYMGLPIPPEMKKT